MTINMRNNDNNEVPKTKYNSNNFRVTQNDVTVIFDEVAEQLRLVNFWRNQKLYKLIPKWKFYNLN